MVAYETNKANGYGWRYIPSDSIEPDWTLPDSSIITERILEAHEAVLIIGEPGVGKTETCLDVASSVKLPALMLPLHINAGKVGNNLTDTMAMLHEFSQDHFEGLVVVDNVDFIAYKGKSRSLPRSAQYAKWITDALLPFISQSSLRILGTAHTQLWRDGNWKYHEHPDANSNQGQDMLEQIYEAQDSLLELFDEHILIDGQVFEEDVIAIINSLHPAAGELSVTALCSYLRQNRRWPPLFRDIKLFDPTDSEYHEQAVKIDQGLLKRLGDTAM